MSEDQATPTAGVLGLVNVLRHHAHQWPTDLLSASADTIDRLEREIALLREKCARIADDAALSADRTKDEHPRQSIEWCCAIEAATSARYIAAAIRAPLGAEPHA